MTALDALLVALGVIVTILVGRLALGATWRGIGVYRLWRAGPRHLLARRQRIWRAPRSTHADAVHGPGSPAQSPTPPFHFIEEHTSGSQPCVSVRDARGQRWRVKWGGEVHSETFAVRVAWACGYFSEVTYFVKSGDIHGVSDLRRASACIEPAGTFCDARFELDDPDVRKLFEEHSWAWDDNPFLGTPALSGLKIVVMLLSNWDTKDRRDVARGSNTAIFEHRRSGWTREARYLLTDWGGSMGKWGSNIATRGRWDPTGFEQQTPEYVTGVKDSWVQFGYVGQRTVDIARNISVDDVRWFVPYLSRLDETFLRQALLASGASDDEATRFTHALLARIQQLKGLSPALRLLSSTYDI